MARAPRAGRTKTRLQPWLGPGGCARLQSELIRHTAGWVAESTRPSWLAFTPIDAKSEMTRLVPRTVSLFGQAGGSLGERLRHATAAVFRVHPGPLAVVGTDAPELGLVHLRCVERALADGRDACLIPALDGGYALIALARPLPGVFELPAAAWGGSDVLELTLSRLERRRRSWSLLEPVRDLDTPDDARCLAADPGCPAAIRRALEDRTAV